MEERPSMNQEKKNKEVILEPTFCPWNQVSFKSHQNFVKFDFESFEKSASRSFTKVNFTVTYTV